MVALLILSKPKNNQGKLKNQEKSQKTKNKRNRIFIEIDKDGLMKKLCYI
jgi:hypothetical protein